MKLLSGILWIVLVSFAVCDDPNLYTCTPRDPNLPLPTQPTNAPALPVVPTTFSTKLEATLIFENRTVSGEEYFDYNNNRAALFMLRYGNLYKLIFDYNTDELFYVLPDGSCQTANLTSDDNNLLFGNVQLQGGLHVFTTNGALHFAAKYGQTYMGKAVVRGVNCDHWRTCLTWAQLRSTFTLDYYFTSEEWMPADGKGPVPVRAEIFGYQTQDNANPKQFHHVYDYTDFTTSIDPQTTVFETPSKVVCTGRKQIRATPQLKNAFSYREEIVSNSGVSTTADVWYDQTYRLVRYDFRPQQNAAPYYNADAATEIHDYNTGVAYAIDKVMGNCSVIPILNASFDASINVTSSVNKQQFVLKMKTPADLFYLDGNYTYSGQRQARGLTCDVFIRKVTNFQLGAFPFNATLEFYFLSNGQTENNNDGAMASNSVDVPVQLIVWVPSIPYTVTYSFYDFDQEDPEITNFDVSSCFDDESKIGFKVTFYGTFDATVMSYKTIFLFQTISAVASAAGVSPLRISNPQFYMQPDQAYFVATLLDEAPVLQRYRKIPGKVVQFNNDAVIPGVYSPSDCASACLNNGNWTCNSFEYCPLSKVCTLSKIHTSEGTVKDSAQNCDLYDRTLGSTSYQEVPLSTAWENIQNSVDQHSLQIQITFNQNTQTYTAQDVANDIVNNPDLSNGGSSSQSVSATVTNNFRVMHNKYVDGFDDDILTGMSIDDCAQACVTTLVFECNSFEYNTATSYCYLSHLHPDETPKKIKSILGTDLYIRDYSAKFNKLPGKTVLSTSNVIYQQIFDTNQCAKLCVDYQGFNCKSFDFCGDIGTCFLGSKHVFDLPKASISTNPLCDHWSRKYIADFTQTARKTFKMVNDRIIDGISIDQCAKDCVDQEGGSCASFGYCDKAQECRLSTASMKNIGQVSLEASATCDVYTRQSFPDGSAFNSNPQKYYSTQKSSSGGLSSGTVGGIAFGMIILGIILTIVGLAAYLKITNKRLDDMTIKFSRHTDEE